MQYWEDCEIYDFSDSESISIISSICGSKWMNGQEYLLVSYADASKRIEWHPRRKNINYIQQHEETPKLFNTTTINATTTCDAPIKSSIMISSHDNQESISIIKKSKESKELFQPSLQNSADDNITYSPNNLNHHFQSNNQSLLPLKTFLQQPNVKNFVKTKLIKQRNLNLYDANVRNSNDELKTLIEVPLIPKNNSSSQWTGNLFKGETPELIGNVIIKPLEGRCQNSTYLSMISKIDQLWMRNFIPQSYAESMIKNNNPVEYPMFTMGVTSVTKSFIKSKEPKNNSESNGSIGTIWINEKEKLCWLVFPNYHRTSVILRLYPDPEETFILVTKKLPENCKNDASDFLKIQKPIVDINQNFEVQKLIQCFINLGGIYDKNLKRKDISYYMIHVEKLNQICFIPHQIELKHTSCKFYIFGWNLEGSNPIDFYEIWSQEGGGLVTTTPKVYLTDKIDKICGIKNWENINVEVLYKTMVNMQSIHCKNYRHFILVIDESEKYEEMKFNCVCGVEKLTFDIFEAKYGPKSFKLL
ncbi:2641_t:CDS:10 [Diversispora eburnea]|uniref:2641_t:CDS:1 n=1 Tax=Diversispora eburnea TaxID=1213867 RepID=A0A9N9BW72_9GLOM|nr:2641_t:CDS:10 [Diversispora eburnea]